MVALGRLVEFDERSRNYPIRQFLDPRAIPKTNFWRCEKYLDQGNVGACVGFSWAHELAADPEQVYVDSDIAMSLYRRAQQLDEWPGENYEGTSVLAGAKAVMEKGDLIEYRWGFGLDDMLQTLTDIGPVVIGVNWYDSMFDINADGYLDVSGNVVGGHAILVKGLNMEQGWVLLHNSWGISWGDAGTARLLFGDLDRLLKEDGECCIPLVRSIVEPIPPQPEPSGCLPKSVSRVARWMKR